MTDPTPAPAQQGAPSPEREAEIRAWSARSSKWGVAAMVAELIDAIDAIRDQHAHLLAERAQQPAAISPEREAEIRHRWEYVKAGFERTYLGDLLEEIDALRAQHEGDRRMLRLAINAQKRRAEIAEQQLAQHEGDAQILGDHIAALGDWQRASERDGQTIAGLEAQVADLREHALRLTTMATAAEQALADERARNAPLRARIKEMQDAADKRIAPIAKENSYWRQTLTLAMQWMDGHQTDEEKARIQALVDSCSPEFGERIVRVQSSLVDRFQVGVLLRQAERLDAALADERAVAARLKDQISTARAQLDAWQHNAPGATAQAAAATLAAGPGPEAPETAAPGHVFPATCCRNWAWAPEMGPYVGVHHPRCLTVSDYHRQFPAAPEPREAE